MLLHAFGRRLRAILQVGMGCVALAATLGAEDGTLRVQLKWYHQFQFAGFYAAQAQGYYREAGLQVELVEAGPQTDPITEVLSGRAHYGVADSRLVLHRLAGQPVVALAVIFQHSPAVLVVRSGVLSSGLQDLAGKRIMVDPQEAEIMALLARVGLSKDRTRLVPQTFQLDQLMQQQVEALSAYATNELFRLDQAGFPYQAFTPRALGVDFYGDNLFTSETELRQAPQRVKAFRAATLKGWSYAMANPEALAQWIHANHPGRKSLEALRHEARQMAMLIQPELVELGYMNPGRWEHITTTYRELGLLPQGGSLAGFLYHPDPPQDLTPWLRGSVLLLVAGGLTFLVHRQAALRRLRTAHAFSEQVIHSAQEGIIVYDREGRIRTWNAFMEGLSGRPAAEIIGQSLSKAGPFIPASSVQARVHAVLQHQTPDAATFHWRDPHSDRQGWVTSRMAPLHDPQGRVLGVIETVSDISDLKALTTHLQRVTAAVEQSPACILITDAEGRIQYVNPAYCKVFGYTEDERLDQDVAWQDAFAPSDAEAASLAQALRNGAVWRGEGAVCRKDGSSLWVRTTLSPIRLEDGTVTGYVAVQEDITEHRQAQAAREHLEHQLQQSQKLESLGSLAGGIAHDMNNVLGAILSLSTTQAAQPKVDPALQQSLQTISQACLRGREVIKGLLRFARKDLESFQLLDPNHLVRELVQLLAHTTLKRVTLTTDLQEPISPVLGDAGALNHALMNLCVNAVDAMPQGGSLSLITRQQGAQVILQVRDTGCGMDPETQARAMDPFFTTKPLGKGTGLGLSMVFGTLQAHQGELSIESQPGEGTTVTLTLPAHAGSTPDEAPQEAPAAGKKPHPLNVLLVDDDDLVTTSVSMMLETLGHRVTTASGGAEGLQHLDAGLDPDLVILDMNMPGMNGAETLTRIQERRPQQWVLLASGYSDQNVPSLIQGRPHCAALAKPFTLEELQLQLSNRPT